MSHLCEPVSQLQNSEYFRYTFLESEGFQRKQCTSCGYFFWTSDSERKTCGDPPCDSYGFVGNPPVEKPLDFREMRNRFISFFSGTHKTVEPYPVIPRWRDDVLLVNASIYDFQPHVTSGLAEPPGNPLVMSQPCLRMIDIDNVGKTGRHLTSFEMMCHDAFNTRGKDIYWKNEAVEYCHGFLNGDIGIEQDLIVYKEKPWSGGGNGGEALEVFVKGLEVATLVFMDMVQDSSGSAEIDGEKYSRMENRIIDTGYGLERLAWLTDGKNSIYSSLYPEMMDFLLSRTEEKALSDDEIATLTSISSANPDMKENEIIAELVRISGLHGKEGEKLVSRYVTYRNASIIADHSRTILLLLNDKVVPSNVKVGYVLRMLIRRTLRSIRNLGIEADLLDLVEMQRNTFQEIATRYDREFAEKMIRDETGKSEEILRTGSQMVSHLIERKKKLDESDLLQLYDSNGMDPDIVSGIYREKTGNELEVPEDFHSRVISLHTTIEKKKKKRAYPQFDTRTLYYDDPRIKDFTGIVVYSEDGKVILNQTAFYPEGGGQPSDQGVLERGPKKYRVRYVEKSGKSIVHHVDGNPGLKERLQGHIDYERRWQLMIHHTATHLLLAVTREILGSHVWQTGVQKGIDSSRIDVVHYSKISEEEISRIETRCLEAIEQDRKVSVRNIDWNVALEKYGFTLFQGGVPLDSKIRVVTIDGIDAEGCGGTHLLSTGPIGMIKILSAESIQEGIQRITFAAGPALLRYVGKLQNFASSARTILKTDIDSLGDSLSIMSEENRNLHKALEKEEKKRVQAVIDRIRVIQVNDSRAGIVEHSLDENESKLLVKAVNSLGFDIAVLVNSGEESTSVISNGRIDAAAVLERIFGGKQLEKAIRGKRFSKLNRTAVLDENLIRQVFV